VISFHSLEDRIVKRFLSPEKSAPARSRHLPAVEPAEPRWRDVHRPVKPGAAELAANPRARSAVLRSARRTAAPARPVSAAGLGLPALGGTV
jgi:16S rRNA (cytosine1402-N4)-methyltransferase